MSLFWAHTAGTLSRLAMTWAHAPFSTAVGARTNGLMAMVLAFAVGCPLAQTHAVLSAIVLPMKRLTIGGEACIETLALLISMAWADGRLEDQERDGIRAAAGVFNLTRELRDRLDDLLEKPIAVEELLVEELSPRDKAFAYVAAAWLSGVDEDVDAKEQELLERLASLLALTDERRRELDQIARDLEPLRRNDSSWTKEIVSLFKAIPARLEGDGTENFDVAFE